MDETIKIYNPIKRFATPPISAKPVMAEIAKSEKKEYSHLKKTESKWKYFFDPDLWKDVLERDSRKRRELHAKYPWVPITFNWIMVVLVILLFVSFIIWGVNIHTERTAIAYAETVAEQKDAEHQAFLAQMEADKKAAEESLERLMQKNATAKAKLGYGSRNFKDKFNYGDDDFMTLFQCVDNRLKNSMYAGMTIEEIVFQDGQFVASFDTNPSQDYYYNLAMKSERLKQEREVQGLPEPVGSDYVYAIYTGHGIYLSNDPKAPQYTWWHYHE